MISHHSPYGIETFSMIFEKTENGPGSSGIHGFYVQESLERGLIETFLMVFEKTLCGGKP